ncbi:hypothetical protein SDRG_06092 [Saprolegnia diclina VS20]|uniref:RING-CH-type domain-containing protein n=1 Tax=Saprolegnia diclina (strain VS20) TaxID=1156394 RepID=T0QRR3_SAPDV|nr:hypothetical protein SDRG_06092 [Saprolegnia diclina VS20]EQC36655.1 hypothetical protein SDRG_06092 [Saprolegnia diclina VS20]|eukprot:XP_008610076.1 hypothetical protein SDRG_06092 [Saprolegnia diclina VS20]
MELPAKTADAVVVTVAASAPASDEAIPVLPSSPYCCFYCLDDGNGPERSATELIAPCACATYIHRDCLDTLRVSSRMPNAMTHCGTCGEAFAFLESGEEAEYKRLMRKAQLLRFLFVLGVVFLGSCIIWLIDRGTPKSFHLNWNGMDGQIYDTVGLKSCPRLLVYFLTSLALTAFIIGAVAIISLCVLGCRDPATNCYCPGYYDCDCGGGDCGGDAGAFILVFVLVLFIFVGLYMMLMAIVGAFGSTVNRIGQRRVRAVEVRYRQVVNLRPIPATSHVATMV